MNFKHHTNRVLRRVTGYELTRATPVRLNGSGPVGPVDPSAGQAERLLRRPVFIMSSVRSGSTLLRVILDAHSQLYSPHELHLKDLHVDVSNPYVEKAMAELGFDQRKLEHLLWDRLLAHELGKSGKKYLVNKTPNDVFIWRRILRCWPDARFLYLLRHPAAIARSWHKARPWTEEEAIASALRYMEAVEKARAEVPGLTVRYEELTADPAGTTKRICEFLEIPWEPEMLDYGRRVRGSFRAGLGDWTKKIKSGRIQEATPPPPAHEIPEQLKDICQAWGYPLSPRGTTPESPA